MMEKLNSDTVLEIRSRLPIKSVLQCRKVCKLWRNLFRKPNMGMLFVHKPRLWGDVELLFREHYSEMVNLSFAEEEKRKFYHTVTKIGGDMPSSWSFRLVGSCNGLVCYTIYENGFDNCIMYIFNPITNERIRVPKMGAYSECAGFGYCHSTGTYKVVQIRHIKNGKRSVQVCTLGDGSGCREKPEITYLFKESGVFANGALYWLNLKSNFDIVAFDLADETFQSIPLPPLFHFPSNSFINVTLEGDLCLCFPCIKQGETTMDVWLFKKINVINKCQHSTRSKERTNFNSFSWIKVASIKWNSSSQCHLLSQTKTEILLWRPSDVLSCYDTATFERLWYVEGPRSTNLHAIPHMHSVVSLKDLGEELVERPARELVELVH